MNLGDKNHISKENSSERNIHQLPQANRMMSFFRARVDELIQLTDGLITSKMGRYIPVAIFATSIATTTHLWEKEYTSIMQNLSDQLDKQLSEAIYPIQGRIRAYDQILLGIHGLFYSSKTITRNEFNSYIESLNLKQNFPEVPGISISYKLTKNTVGKHITEIQKEGFLDYGMNFDLSQQAFAPVVFVEPFAGKNLHVFGYDNFSNPTRKNIMEQSQEIHESILSDPVCLVQENEGKANSSFLMFHPLYGKKVPHSTELERRENIFGWSAIAFRFTDLISQVSRNRFSDIDLRIYDGIGQDESKLLFDSTQGKKNESRFSIKKIKTLDINGRDWTFVVGSTDTLEKSMHHKEYLDNILYSGGIVTFLLTLFSFIFIKTRREALVTIKNLKESTTKIMELALHDPLTKLPNRMGFLDGLSSLMAHAIRNDKSVALMFIDLDKFKYVNDTYGHQVGDELLIEVASRMKKCVRKEDIIGRPGGDEFLMALSDIKNPDSAANVASKIISTLAEPFNIQGHEIYIGSSIGISMYPDDADNIENLQMYADMAMYSVKNHGRNGYHFYSSGMQKSSEEYQLIATALHRAIERNEFHMAYQPIVDTKTGNIESMEALLRWQHPELGSISPAKFIPIAESDSETIISIGKWTIDAVCSQIAEWKKTGSLVPRIAINLSARQFLSKNLVSDILDIIQKHGVYPHEIGLEITEGTLFKDIDSAISVIANLSEIGFDVSIDDFGTGYSSLSYLRRFKVLKLKIDRSFVIDIHSEIGERMLDGIIALAHKLGIKVIAEGVEEYSQVAILKKLGCDYVQGYYFARPEDAQKVFPRLIQKNVFDKVLFIDHQME